MITLLLLQGQKSIFSILGDRIQEGGTKTMTLLIILLILEAVLIIKSFILFKKGENTKKNLILINSIAFFALVLGVFGHVLGLVATFDSISSSETLDSMRLGNGIKRTILPILLGSFIFLFTRVFTILLTWLTPKKHFDDEQAI